MELRFFCKIIFAKNLLQIFNCYKGDDNRYYEKFFINGAVNILDKDLVDLPNKWEWSRLEVISKAIKAGGDKPTELSMEKNDEFRFPIYSNGLQNDGLYGYGKYATITEPSLTISARGTIGYSFVRLEPFTPIVRLITVIPTSYLSLDYLNVVISNLIPKGEGSSIPQLTVPGIKPKLIPIPPYNEQLRIVKRVYDLYELINIVEQNKIELDKLKEIAKSKVLDLAIQGKLVEQDPNDEPASILLEKIRAEKEQMVREGKLKKKDIANDSIIYKGDDNCYYEKYINGITKKLDYILEFELPNTWEISKFKNVCTITRGGSPRPIKDFITNDKQGINWIKIGDAKKGSKYICTTKEKIKPEGISKSRFVEIGDFLLTNSMSFGRPYVLKTSGCIHDGWLVIGETNKCFYQDYLYYLISSNTMYSIFKNKASGSTVENLNSDLVKESVVIIPPINEQERISKKIEEILKKLEVV